VPVIESRRKIPETLYFNDLLLNMHYMQTETSSPSLGFLRGNDYYTSRYCIADHDSNTLDKDKSQNSTCSEVGLGYRKKVRLREYVK
jgi:hypothetical protein